MFNVIDTAFSYGRALIACLFLQESSKGKESGVDEIWNADIAFLLGGAELIGCVPFIFFPIPSHLLFSLYYQSFLVMIICCYSLFWSESRTKQWCTGKWA